MSRQHEGAAVSVERNGERSGASPVSLDAYLEARQFIPRLPASLPPPRISVTKAGAIALQWRSGSRWAFSLVFSGRTRVTYSGLLGLRRMRGEEQLRDEIPALVLVSLWRWLLGSKSQELGLQRRWG